MKKILVSLSFLTATTAAPLSHAADALAVPDLITTWAKALNKTLVWEAGNDYRGRTVQFDAIDGARPDAIEPAFAGLNAVLEKAGHVPLKVCLFDKVLIVRRVTQPACNKPI